MQRLKRDLPPAVAAARVTIEQLETGPPIGVPVQIRLFGDDIETLRRIAAETKQQLREIPGTDNIHDDWDVEVFQLAVTINADKANLSAGITNEDVAMLLANRPLRRPHHLPARTGPADSHHLPLAERRACRGSRRSTISMWSARATNARVPISQIADLSTKLVSPKICRRDHQRCITVKCDTVPGVWPAASCGRCSRGWPMVAPMAARLPLPVWRRVRGASARDSTRSAWRWWSRWP